MKKVASTLALAVVRFIDCGLRYFRVLAGAAVGARAP
jgi:hypothetical protein